MKQIMLAACILTFITTAVKSQMTSDSLSLKGSRIFYKGQRLTPGETLMLIKDSTEAHHEMEMAINNYTTSAIIGGIGGFLIGFNLGQNLAGKGESWVMAGVGAGIVLISIPFSVDFKSHARKAVELHNSSLGKTGNHKIRLKLRPGLSSLNLALLF